MKISFLLPEYVTEPDGQIGTIIKLGQELSYRGHEVTLIYPLSIKKNFFQSKIQSIERIIQDWKGESGLPEKPLFYSEILDLNIQVVQKVQEKYIPEADSIVATDWKTCRAINNLSDKHGQKYFLIQVWEPYFHNNSTVLNIYQNSVNKIAISSWIKEKLVGIGQNPLGPLGNYVDQDDFYCYNSYKDRKYDIGLYLNSKIRKPGQGIKTLKKIKKKIPAVKSLVLSSGQPDCKIPDWVELNINPDVDQQREAFNNIKVLAYHGQKEGWPIEPMQALACGCVLVSVPNQGIKEYIDSEENGIIVDREKKWFFFDNSMKNMASEIYKILSNPSKGEKFSRASRKTVEKHNRGTVIERLEDYLEN